MAHYDDVPPPVEPEQISWLARCGRKTSIPSEVRGPLVQSTLLSEHEKEELARLRNPNGDQTMLDRLQERLSSDARKVKYITLVTLIYLPGTFYDTFYGVSPPNIKTLRSPPSFANSRISVSAGPYRCTFGCRYRTKRTFDWRHHEETHEPHFERYLARADVLYNIADHPWQNRWTLSMTIIQSHTHPHICENSPGNFTLHGTSNSAFGILFQNDPCGKDSECLHLNQSILRNHANRSRTLSSCIGSLYKLIASCRPCLMAMFVFFRQVPQALASNEERHLSHDQSIFNQESPLDHALSALMLIYLLFVWKIGAKAKVYALAFMLAMSVLWLPLIGDRSGVCKTIFKVWAATTFHYVVQDCVDAVNLKLHVLKFLGLSMLFLIVGASLQQFAADSVLNVLPPSLALAAVINWALPQPPRIRAGADEEAVYESIARVDNADGRNYGPYQSAAGARLSQGSNVSSSVFSIRYDSTTVPDDDPIELVPSIGHRSDTHFVPGDDSVTS